MKSVRFALLVSAFFLPFASVVAARNIARSKQRFTNPTYKTFNWWPRSTYESTQNGITLKVKPLSEQETAGLFLSEGVRLVASRGYYKSNPILPLAITVQNDSKFPVTVSKKNIDLGKNWFGSRYELINLRNISETLERAAWSSKVFRETTYVSSGGLLPDFTITTYKDNPDFLIYREFFLVDAYSLDDLSSLDLGILGNQSYSASQLEVAPGQTRQMLVFAWASQVTSNLNISIAKNVYRINLFESTLTK